MESRLNAIVDKVKKLKADTLPFYEPLYEAPSNEPSCEEPSCDDEPSYNDRSLIKPSCKPIYEPLRRYSELSI
jgi:ABC-type cobalt transport system substrate-binding protein